MSAHLRTVRLLDRGPGVAFETREVDGIVIEKGIPVPELRNGRVTKAIKALEVGESFQHPFRIAPNEYHKKMPGRKFVTKKEGGKYRIWRVK